MDLWFSPKLLVRILLSIGFVFSVLSFSSCSSANVATSPSQSAASATDQLNQAETRIDENTSPAATKAEAASASSTESPANQIQPNKSLKIAIQPIVQIDPAFISSDSEVLLANLVYDYLIDTDVDGKLTPRLAESWTSNQDGTVYTLTITKSAHFHDGSLLTVDDVVWTFERLRDPALELPTSSLYSNIEQITADAENSTLTFTLKQPNPFFLYDLSANQALVLKKGTTNADKEFNGTGPYRVKSYLPEDRVILEANPHYFISGLPKMTNIELIFFTDETAMANALRSQQIDMILRLGTESYTSLENQAGIKTIVTPANGFDLVRLRSDRPPGNNPKVIQALKLATDRETIFQLVQQKYGAVGRDCPIGPMYKNYYTEDPPIPPRDVEKARRLLKEAGYPDGLTLDMHVPDSGNRPNLAVVLKDQWAEAGININVIIEPESIYYGENKWLEADLGITGWSSRPYPQFYLDVMLKCNGSWNEAHFCDKEFDELATIGGTTMDEAERVKAYREIQRLCIERVPIIIPYFMANFAATRDNIEGFELKGFSGRSDLRVVKFMP